MAGTTPSDSLRLFFSTTDHSGDQHAAAVIEEIRRLRPRAEFAGLGGPQMAQAGCQLLADTVEQSAMWFSTLIEVSRWLRRFRRIERFWSQWRPDVFVPIDSPGVNFPLARRARKHGIRSVYYIPPQIWAWGRWRLRKLRRLFTRLLVALPLERSFYGERGFDTLYVGHPLFDYLPRKALTDDLHGQLGLEPATPLIGLLPGSRRQEVRRIMPILREAALIIRQCRPAARFAIGAAGPALLPDIQAALAGSDLACPILLNQTLELMRDARLCLVASGTATLQLVHFATPMVVVYRLNGLEWLIMRLLKRSRYVGLVNVLADRELAPEFVTCRDRSRQVAESALPLLGDSPERRRMVEALRALRGEIDHPGACRRAAEAIIQVADG